jgi:hypothetical protein
MAKNWTRHIRENNVGISSGINSDRSRVRTMLFIKAKEVWKNLSISLKEEICAEMQAVVREVIDEQFRTHSGTSHRPQGGDLHPTIHGTSGGYECGESKNAARHAGAGETARVG